jgi:hypothetical protein
VLGRLLRRPGWIQVLKRPVLGSLQLRRGVLLPARVHELEWDTVLAWKLLPRGRPAAPGLRHERLLLRRWSGIAERDSLCGRTIRRHKWPSVCELHGALLSCRGLLLPVRFIKSVGQKMSFRVNVRWWRCAASGVHHTGDVLRGGLFGSYAVQCGDVWEDRRPNLRGV